MNSEEYLEKVYSGLLGKCIGVRLGAPVEPAVWSYERIKEVYGEIRRYVKDYRNFAADDDVNGPLFFIRSLLDHSMPLTAEKIGQTWLNYTREGKGFFWWGGEGISTEHTAFLNLKKGIPAPRSGSAEVNGLTLSEQIGGQIFIDTWGLVFPDDPVRAAEYAAMAASVSHDRNGIYGGIFISTAISLAFSLPDVSEIIEKALSFIPGDCEYTKVVTSVRDFHKNNPEDWRSALEFLISDFGYDRYPGICHIIPNSGVVALSLYYGNGDFAKTVEIATMCGWDTDCNAGNAGSILGVINGPDGIPRHYREPVHDFHAASSIAGSLNIIDLPSAAKEIAILGLKNMGKEIPLSWWKGAFSNNIHLDFSLPCSTSGIRTSNPYLVPVIKNNGEAGLFILLDRFKRGDKVRVFYKPYYTREDFDDERYSPTFTPTVYSGQILKIKGIVEKLDGEGIEIMPYVRDSRKKEIFTGSEFRFEADKRLDIEWKIPQTPFAIDEAGLIITQHSEGRFLGNLTLFSFDTSGKIEFTVDFKDEKKEFDGLSRCSLTGGNWELTEDALYVSTKNTFLLLSGPYYSKDYCTETTLIPAEGKSHLLAFRSIGTERGYFFGLHGKNRAVLIKRDHENMILAEKEFPWNFGESYTLMVKITGSLFRCFINGVEIISYTDTEPFPSGMAGFGMLMSGKTNFCNLVFHEIRI